MPKKRIYTVFCAVMSLMLLISAAVPIAAFAGDDTEIDMQKKGSIEISLFAGEAPVSDAEVRLYKIADIDVEGYNYVNRYTEDFADCGVDIEQLYDNADAPVLLADYVTEKEIAGESAVTDKDGMVKFADVPVGVYLILHTDFLADYMSVSPFIASVPIMNEEGTGWQYDVSAKPKTQSTESCPKKITVKKIWNDKEDDKKQRPTEIKVHLFKRAKLYDSVVLNEENDWMYTWTNLPMDFTWNIVETGAPDCYYAEYTRTDCYNFLITNTYGDELVKTGQNWLPVPILAFVGVLLISVGLILRRKKKA